MASGNFQKQGDANFRRFHKYDSLSRISSGDLKSQTLIFNVEESLLRSASLFPYFMLVAFEAGGLLRALVLLFLYPLLRLVSQELELKIMVFVCFFGVRKKSFTVGRTVLPKYFLENVGLEGLEVIRRFGPKVSVTSFPTVMVKDFLYEYMGVETIVARELKVSHGRYLGLMEAETWDTLSSKYSNSVGVCGSHASLKDKFISLCNDIYMVSQADKKNWQQLPKDKYPKPLIFHDGRLAFDPTPEATLVMFIWLPFGFFLCIVRSAIGILLPYSVSRSLLAFTGFHTAAVMPKSSKEGASKQNGIVYVCNHRTLLDPDFISLSCGIHLTALTYRISKLSEMLSPIKTVSLTRDRAKDAEIMQRVLSKGSLVVCPEGTTCREPYLLRFSPLFAEICDDIVPVAIDVKVTMFYGTTASGIKALDPIFFALNPVTRYHLKFLEKLPKSHKCGDGGMSKYDVANSVQEQIGAALGFQCTSLTRKDKYMILAGNAGI